MKSYRKHPTEDASLIKNAPNLKPPFPTASYKKGKAPLIEDTLLCWNTLHTV